MTSTFKQFSGIRETVPAWDGIKWHEAVEALRMMVGQDTGQGVLKGGVYFMGDVVTKSTILVREWGVCPCCTGEKRCVYWRGRGNLCEDNNPKDCPHVGKDAKCEVNGACPHCHKDADGNPTGAEPGTAKAWEVRDD